MAVQARFPSPAIRVKLLLDGVEAGLRSVQQHQPGRVLGRIWGRVTGNRSSAAPVTKTSAADRSTQQIRVRGGLGVAAEQSSSIATGREIVTALFGRVAIRDREGIKEPVKPIPRSCSANSRRLTTMGA